MRVALASSANTRFAERVGRAALAMLEVSCHTHANVTMNIKISLKVGGELAMLEVSCNINANNIYVTI